MTFIVPDQIRTPRLLLRQLTIRDWDVLLPYYSSPVTTRYTTGRPLSRAETWRSIACMIGHWQIHGYGPYALEMLDSGKLIGICGYWYPGEWPEPEIKWGLLEEHQGAGFAKEAATAVLDQATQHLPDIHFISLIHPENQASINLARSLGAQFEKEIEFWWDRFQIYRHRRSR